MTKPIKDMIAEANEETDGGGGHIDEGGHGIGGLGASETITVAGGYGGGGQGRGGSATIELEWAPTIATDPLQRGMGALRARELEPLRIWSVKGPKGVGGLVCAIFLQATSEIVLMHQLPSGKFTVFSKTEVDTLSVEDV